MDRHYRLAGAGTYGRTVCADVGSTGVLLNYVPNIGAVISAVPPMIQVLLFNGVYECILIGALFLVVHMVIGNILEPRMMGHRWGCPPWWYFFHY